MMLSITSRRKKASCSRKSNGSSPVSDWKSWEWSLRRRKRISAESPARGPHHQDELSLDWGTDIQGTGREDVARGERGQHPWPRRRTRLLLSIGALPDAHLPDQPSRFPTRLAGSDLHGSRQIRSRRGD